MFCETCKTTENYLRKAMSTRQLLGSTLCVSIEQTSDGQITRKDLRPDDWQDIWPELAIRRRSTDKAAS